ncbi:hypothetical protein [Desulfosediminicola ganghwensis]|uniref:hypothetical protein n=1 Tax=Desulfosediminicola ganghwensis TaxID=2569540 RepID=UPI0010ACB78C|nr:hypothetical protein [Desulfosediminicola ganghwensis]
MPRITIDANIFKNYYEEAVLEGPCCLTKSSKPIFEDTSLRHILILDDGGIIEHEWKEPICSEWFDAWIIERMTNGHIELVPTNNHPDLSKSLYNLGFPKGERDIWYIRVAKTCAERTGSGYVITEDIDFFAPKQKKTAKAEGRIKLMRSKSAPIKKYLRKNEHIEILCVKDYL